MNIAFLSTIDGTAWGGSEELWSVTALAARQKGHQVTASVHHWPQPRPKLQALQSAGVRLGEHLPYLSRQARRKQRFFIRHPNVALRWTPRLSVFGKLLRPRPDVVCISQGDTYGITQHFEFDWLLQYLEREKIPVVVICHLSQEDRFLPDGYVEKARQALARVASLAFVSERQKKVVECQIAQALPQALVLRNPVNLADTSLVNWPGSDTARFAIVARVAVVHKGHDLALRALAEERWKKRDWKLSIVGSGPHDRYVMDLARFLGIADRVEHRGHQSDIRKVWAEHHALLLPSRMEAAPLTIVEAMLCGRPCIGTDVGGVAEWIEEGATGWVADFPHVRSVGDALERAWTQREHWPRLGRQGREKALRQIDPDPGATLLGLLEKAAGQSR